jgi:hypothetical protein
MRVVWLKFKKLDLYCYLACQFCVVTVSDSVLANLLSFKMKSVITLVVMILPQALVSTFISFSQLNQL